MRSWIPAALIVIAFTAPRLGAQTPARLSLDAAIAEALAHSPDLSASADALAMADIQRRLVASQFGVKITPSMSTAADPVGGAMRMAGVSITKRLPTGAQAFASISATAFGSTVSGFRDAGYTVGFSQPLMRGLWATANVDKTNAARATTTAERSLAASQSALVVRVAAQYFTVVKQTRLVGVLTQAADRAGTFVASWKARADAGLGTELDVLRAEIQQSTTRAALADAEAALASARDGLARLMGRPLATGTTSLDVELSPPAVNTDDDLQAVSVDTLVQRALGNRLEVVEARDRIQDAARASKVAKWNVLPPLSLDVSYTQRGLGSASGAAYNALVGGWHVGISTTYSTDRAGEVAAAESAGIASAAAERAAVEVEQRVAADVRQLHRAWLAAGAREVLQRQTRDLAERELQLAQLRAGRGLATSLDVVSAESNLLRAEEGVLAAELDRSVSLLDLKRAVGLIDPARYRP